MIVETYSYIKKKDVFIDISNGGIYSKKINNIDEYKENKKYLNSADVTDILNEFLNTRSSKDMKKFIEKYGVIQEVFDLSDREYRKCKFPIKKGYIIIGELSEYSRIRNNMNRVRADNSKINLLSDFLKGNFDYSDEAKIRVLEEWIGESIDISSAEQCISLEFYLDEVLHNNINRYLEEINICVVRDGNGNIFQTYEYPSLKAILYAKIAEEIASGKTPLRCKNCGKWTKYRKGKLYCSECTQTKRKEKFLEKSDKDKEKIYAAVRDHIYTKCIRQNSNSINVGIYQYAEKVNDAEMFNDFYERWRESALEIKKRSSNIYSDLDNLCKKVCSCRKCQAGLATYFKNKMEKKLQSE